VNATFLNFVASSIESQYTLSMRATFILILALVLFDSCEKENQQNAARKIIIAKSTREIIANDNNFGFTLFKEVVASEKEAKNILISPTSVALALAMVYNGADGNTKAAMESALHKTGFSLVEINSGYKSLMEGLVSVDPKVLLEIANSIWYRQNFDVLPAFISVNQQYYSAEINALDFDSPSSADAINGWVYGKTQGKIPKIVDQISPETVMYLINAIYFKGIWRSEFDKSKTLDGEFTTDDGTRLSLPMMHQQDTFNYAMNDQFEALELPYGQGNFNMIVLLPKLGITLHQVINSMTADSWSKTINSLSAKVVVVQLPKFSFEYKSELNNELDSLGMGIAFTDNADFSGINPGGSLKISKVLHKTFVEVDEEGTEAAAVTSVEIVITAYPGEKIPVFFTVDRPFIFAIREKDTGSVLFIGCVQNPSRKSNE
jgi:serine protease inhibitor